MAEDTKQIMAGFRPNIVIGNSRLDRLEPRGSEDDKEKVCKNFESYMIFSMLRHLEKTAKMSNKGYAEETYMAMVYEKVADFLADKGIGVKEVLMRYSDRENAKVISQSGDNTGK